MNSGTSLVPIPPSHRLEGRVRLADLETRENTSRNYKKQHSAKTTRDFKSKVITRKISQIIKDGDKKASFQDLPLKREKEMFKMFYSPSLGRGKGSPNSFS